MKEDGISVIGVIPRHSQNNIYTKVKMPPVGIISVLSQLNNFGFKEVYAIDENNYGGPMDSTGMPDHTTLQKREPAKIAMFYGGMSNSIPRMFSLAQQYKKFGAITIAGGSHVDALPGEALKSGIDIVVHGEGEYSAQEILKTVVIAKNGEAYFNYDELIKVKGISILDENDKWLFTGKREPIKNLDELVDVDLDLIKYMEKRWSMIPVSRGRGCNYNCEFCAVNRQYGRYKASSPKKVLKQIIRYSEKGYRYFFITDDNFAQSVDEAVELCNMIENYKRKFNKKMELTVQVRSEVAENDRLIEAMKRAGVTNLAIGYESPINEDLRAMNKGVRVEKLLERSIKLSKYFYLHGMFIFGYPKELKPTSEKEPELTLEQRAKLYEDFFKKARIDTVQVLNAVPIPGTGLRAKLEAEGRLLPVGWDKYDGQYLCYDPGPDVNAEELQNIPRKLMKKWYLGNVMNRSLNYGNWMNWVYNTFGFPALYTKLFFHNLAEKKKENLFPKRNTFVNAWGDIKREWRNLKLKTCGGIITRKWLKAYKESDYPKTLKEYFSKKS